MRRNDSIERGHHSSRTLRSKPLMLVVLLTLLSSGCESIVSGQPRNQFQDLPSALTEEVEVKDFLTPWNDSLKRNEAERQRNLQTLRDSYKSAKPKPTD